MNLYRDFVRQVFIRVYRLDIKLVFFDPALWTVALLTFSLVQLFLTLPLPCANRYTVYVHVYSGGEWGSGPQTDKHLSRKVPFKVIFLDDAILRIAFYESYLSTSVALPPYLQGPFTGKFFRWRHFSLPPNESYLSTSVALPPTFVCPSFLPGS